MTGEGIDYLNPAFRNADGSTRILSIWDQNVLPEELPTEEIRDRYRELLRDFWHEGILTGEDQGQEVERRFFPDENQEKVVRYGRVYSKEEIDRALQSDNPLNLVPVTDSNGHGTRVARIAAGSLAFQGDTAQYQDQRLDEDLGAAPEASLVIVKLKEAKQYLKDFYQIREGAVCFQESDLLCAIDFLERFALEQDVPMVMGIALGTNQGDHSGRSPLGNTLKRLSWEVGFAMVGGTGNEGDKRHHYRGKTSISESYKDVEIRVAEQTKGFTLEIWGEIPTVYTVEIVSPLGERIPRLPIRQNQSERFQFIFEGTDLSIDFRLVSMMEGAELIFMRFQNPSSGIWKIRVYGSGTRNGIFDMWLPMTEFMEGDTYFLEPDPDVTLTEPFCAEDAFCVGAYDAITNAANSSSGRGYNRLGIVKPDVAAAEDSFGSSGASALAVGAAALLMEWGIIRGNDTLMDGIKIKNYFILGAQRSGLGEYPNTVWGYGELNIYETLRALQIR